MNATVQTYLHETLGIAPKVRAWSGAGKLPYFLQDAFDVRELSCWAAYISSQLIGSSRSSVWPMFAAKWTSCGNCPGCP